MSYPWGSERRFNAYSDHFRLKYGGRMQKISIDAGFSCPNRDGTCGRGGCTFCDNRAFSPSMRHSRLSITEQIHKGMEFHRTRYRKASSYLAYFQAFSNTYAPIEELKTLYEEALAVEGVSGLIIGTRPDCVDGQKLDYFKELSQNCYLVLEYGLESLKDDTLLRVNRGHDVACSRKAVEDTASRGIQVGGHLILGLPGESRDDHLEMARELGSWPLDTVKFHQLQLIKGTAMAKEYQKIAGDFHFFEMEEYLELMCEIIELLPPRIIVERIAGEVIPGTGLREGWGIRYDQVLKHFEGMLEARDSWQGKKYEGISDQRSVNGK